MRLRAFAISTCFIFLAQSAMRADEKNVHKTALDDYIAKPDPAFKWKFVKTVPGDGFKMHVLEMTSQTWRKPPEVDRAEWQHFVTVYEPDQVKHTTGMLWIGGGRNGRAAPDKPNPQMIMLAKATDSIVTELSQIPNQPLMFYGDGKERVEDDLIAYCWIKFMDTGDATWLPRLAMVKSAVRAMDAATAHSATEAGGKKKLDKFVVAGGSKRGWTTWLTGAVDKRVVGIIPIVIDVVNLKPSMIHHYEALGYFAAAVGDYTHHKVNERMDTPRYAELLKIEDPYYYFDRLTMPKFVVNGSGDQYFMPDSSQYYYDELKGPKYLRYVPNADHGLRGSDALTSVTAFYHSVLKGSSMPEMEWKMQKDGVITVNAKTKPKEVTLWQANNPEARDFRKEKIGTAYKPTKLEANQEGAYVARVSKPEKGWTAYFVELTFDSGEKEPYKLSTQVGVVPDVLPHSIETFRKTIK